MARAAVIPPSPAKRARGRPAAAASTAAARARTKTTTAAATKATIEARKRANARVASRDTDDGSDEDELGPVRAKPGRGRAGTAGRGRKPATQQDSGSDDDDELAQVTAPKKTVRPRARPTAATAASASAATAPKPRGRPKGSTNTRPATTKTRVHREEIDDMDATALRSNLLRGPAKKKTVTFQDLSDSENEIWEEDETFAGRKKAAAKPIRKTPGPGRGRKAVAPKSPAKPLSPKKATQVTKSLSSYAGSDGEDDELFAGKPTIASPAKRVAGKTGLSSPVKRINLTPGRPRVSKTVDENGDPVRRSMDFNDIITVASPNREPSPSPFHFSLRETPRRVAFEPRDSTHTQPLVQPNFGASSQGSPLKASPRKAPVGTPRGAGFGLRDDLGPLSQPNFTPGANSPLKSSPKKGRFGNSFNNTSTMASQPSFTPAQSFSPLKSSPKKGNLAASFTSQSAPFQPSSMPTFNPRISFLQSPAKKPASPFKSSMTTPLTFKSSLLGQPQSTTPDDEGTLHARDLVGIEEEIEMEMEQEQEDSEDELTMDNRYNHSAQQDEVDEMDEISVVGDNNHGHGYGHEDEHMAAGPAPQEESSLDLGEELAETFSVKDDAQIEDTMRNLEAEVNEEDVDGLVQDVLHDFTGGMEETQQGFEHEPEPETELELEPASEPNEHHDTPEYSSEPEAEPASEAYAEHTFDHIERRGYSSQHDEPEPEFETEVEYEHENEYEHEPTSEPNIEHRDTPEYSSESEAESEPNAEHTFDHMNHLNRMREPEYSPERDEPESEQEAEPTSEPNVEHHSRDMRVEEQEYSSEPEAEEESEPEFPQQELPQQPTSEMDDFDQEYSDDMEMVEPTIEHDVRSEDYDGSDEGFDDEGTTLVDLDTTQQQQYAEDVRSPSPQAIEPEREPSPEQVREFRDVGVQFPSPTAPRVATPKDNNYREPTNQQVESDEEVQSEAAQSSVQKRLSDGRHSLFANTPGFSPLTHQFSEWKGATPEGSHPRRPRRGIFSFGDKPRRPSSRLSVGSAVSRQSLSSRKSLAEVSTAHVEEPEPQMEPETLEDDSTKTHGAQPEIFTDPESEPEYEPESEQEPEIPSADVPVSHSIPAQDASPTRSIASVHDEFDDEKENEIAPSSPAVESVPATPMKTIEPPQTFHTVSKVPLKPEGHISPLKMPLKRARSLSNASPTRASPRLRASFLLSQEDESDVPTFSPRKSPRMDESPTRRTPRRSSVHRPRSVERRQSTQSTKSTQSQRKSTKLPSRSPSPTKSPRKSMATSQALQGAVVYVDVHTTEGEDASGIFVELLQQMGARCVKNWAWNPRASFVLPEQGTDQKDGKIGITHVVYKDGGVRTLEKVRSARGLVKCVGVGWVLDCERENQWLDETQYTVDSSIVPRGGGKRRKSMEPRALSNVNGTLVNTATGTPTMDRRRSGYSPAVGSRQQTPTSTRKYGAGQTQAQAQTPTTPGYRFNMDDYAGMSPATPFYLSRAKLVQQTCPPKQTRQGLFPASSVSKSKAHADSPALNDAESSKSLRLKLEAARRKSLAYKPRRESPLVQ